MTKRSICAAACVSIAVAAGAAWAGDGVVEINQSCVAAGCFAGDTAGFPVTISQPGSYRLTSDLTPTTAQVGIDVTAADVAIDLAGFSIRSTNDCSGAPDADVTCTVANAAADGIHSSQPRTRVRAGAVVGMGGSGLELGAQAEVSDVTVSDNGHRGIQIDSGRISGSSAYENKDFGLYVLAGPGLIASSIAARNGFTGLLVSKGSVVHSTSIENRGAGIVLSGLGGSLAIGNVVYDNALFGITAGNEDGYGDNVLNDNNGGGNQVNLGRQLSGNVCGGDLICP